MTNTLDLRLYNDEIMPAFQAGVMPFADELLRRFRGMNDIVRFLRADIASTTPTEEANIGAAADNELNGTTTPVAILAVSDSTDDDVGGSGCSEIIVIGLDSNGNLLSTKVTMNGTADVAVGTFKRLFFAYPSTGTPAGNIILKSAVPTTYLTIAGSAVRSNGRKIYIPSGWAAAVVFMDGKATQAQAGERAFVFARYYLIDGSPLEKVRHIVDFDEGHTVEDRPLPILRVGKSDNTSYLDFSDLYLANAKTYEATIIVALIKSTAFS